MPRCYKCCKYNYIGFCTKYKESILVNLVDKVIGGCEMFREYKYKIRYKFTYTVLLFMLFIFCE